MVQKRKLNRGLEALLGSGLINQPRPDVPDEAPSTAGQSSKTELPIEKLQRGKYQPRREFEPEALKTLSDSISAQGILQPIVLFVARLQSV